MELLSLSGLIADPSLETFNFRYKEASEETQSIAESYANDGLDFASCCERMNILRNKLGLTGTYFALIYTDYLSSSKINPELSLSRVIEQSSEIGVKPLENFSQSTDRIKAISCMMQVLGIEREHK